MSHYTWHNVTESSRVTTKYVLSKVVLWCIRKCSFFNSLNLTLIITGMLSQPCHLLPRFLSSFMLVWMPWTLRSGDSLVIGMFSFIFVLHQFIQPHPFWNLFSQYFTKIVWYKCCVETLSLCWSWHLAFDFNFTFYSPGTSVAVSSILLGLVMVGRAAFVFPLSFVSNLSKKSPNEKIGFRQQVLSCSNCYCFCSVLVSFPFLLIDLSDT
jgi:hypothetical protein